MRRPWWLYGPAREWPGWIAETARDRWGAWRWPADGGPRTLRRPFVCPICNGMCGWTEWVCEYGGPYYECGACNGHGVVSGRWVFERWFWESAPEWVIDIAIRYYEWRSPVEADDE